MKALLRFLPLLSIPLFGLVLWLGVPVILKKEKRDPAVKAPSSFFVVNALTCNPINESYTKEQTAPIPEWALDDNTCGLVWIDIRIRKNLVRSYSSGYSRVLGKVKGTESQTSGPLEVVNWNLEHCILYFDGPNPSKPLIVEGPCAAVDQKLNP